MNDFINSIEGKANNKLTRRKILLTLSALTAGLSIIPKSVFSRDSASPIDQLKALDENKVEFITDDFLLQNKTAKLLYHTYAKTLPIIDYHCHLSPEAIATNKRFKNLTEVWLEGDHYKMRAMRANGVSEKYITGNASDFEKFMKWAETVPLTLMNPLYHWTHLELKRYFGISKLLNPSTAKEIYDRATALLQTDAYRVQGLLKRMKVEVICTTDDPIDSLDHHKQSQGISFRVLPAWRPDKAVAVEQPENFNAYVNQLATASGISISTYAELVAALKKRQEFFNAMGCKLSDHGLETFYAEAYTETEVDQIFTKIRSGNYLTELEIKKYKSAMLIQLAEMNHQYGWTQQFHVGPIRNRIC